MPDDLRKVQGRKYQSSPSEWEVDRSRPHAGFACLKFSISDPQYFMYSYLADPAPPGFPAFFHAVATGDLDGSGLGRVTIIELRGWAENGSVRLPPNFYVQDEGN